MNYLVAPLDNGVIWFPGGPACSYDKSYATVAVFR